ncbi:MAG: hypothetical protein GXP27_08865 [Planctomycetes bacterium]|nr:hypothetical protein [Planctomycetota bacterium]
MTQYARNKLVEQGMIWGPRALCLIFAALVSVFALDAFDVGATFWQNTTAVLIHLIPTGVVLVALAIAWRWPSVGGFIFFGLGIGYTAMAWHHLHWGTGLLLIGPLFLLGALFVGSWVHSRHGDRS